MSTPEHRTQFLEALAAELVRKRATFQFADRKINHAIEVGHITGSDQLLNAQRRAREGLHQFAAQLQALCESDESH